MSNYSTNDNRKVENIANLQNARVDNSIKYGVGDENLKTIIGNIGSMVGSINEANLQAIKETAQKDLVGEAIKAKSNLELGLHTNRTNLQSSKITNQNIANIAANAFNRIQEGGKKIGGIIILIIGFGFFVYIANKKGFLK